MSAIYIFALLLLSALWGSTFFWTKLLLEDFHPVSIVFFRCLFGVLFLLPFLFKKRLFSKMKLSPSLVVVSLLGATIPWTLMTISLQYVETTLGGIINALTPIFGMLLSLVILKSRADRLDWLSLFLGFFGVAFIFIVKGLSIQLTELIGGFILISAALSYSFTGILSTKYQKETSPFILAFTTLLAAMIVCGSLMLFVQPNSVIYLMNSKNVGIYVILGILSSGLGYVIFYYLVAYGGPVYALFITYLMPIVTLLLGYLFLGETVTGIMLIGLVFIFMSIGLANYRKRKEVARNDSV